MFYEIINYKRLKMKKLILFIICLSLTINVFSQKSNKQFKYDLTISIPECSFFYSERGDSTKKDTTFLSLYYCDGSKYKDNMVLYASEGKGENLDYEDNPIVLDSAHYNLETFSIYAERRQYDFQEYKSKIVLVYSYGQLPIICTIYSERKLNDDEIFEIRNDLILGKEPNLKKNGIIEISYQL